MRTHCRVGTHRSLLINGLDGAFREKIKSWKKGRSLIFFHTLISPFITIPLHAPYQIQPIDMASASTFTVKSPFSLPFLILFFSSFRPLENDINIFLFLSCSNPLLTNPLTLAITFRVQINIEELRSEFQNYAHPCVF